jgi:hypothetical protein
MLECTNVSENVLPDPTHQARLAAYPSSLNIYYQNWSAGATYTQSMATTDLKALKFWDSNPTLSIKNYDATNGYNALRVKFPKDLYGGASGVTAETYLADANEYTLEYKVYFEPGFQFSRATPRRFTVGANCPACVADRGPVGARKDRWNVGPDYVSQRPHPHHECHRGVHRTVSLLAQSGGYLRRSVVPAKRGSGSLVHRQNAR